jgi:hypothetical protein
VFGVGVKTLMRLRAAGLAVRVGADHRLVEPIDPARVALAAVGPPAVLGTVSGADRLRWNLYREPAALHVLVPPRAPTCALARHRGAPVGARRP